MPTVKLGQTNKRVNSTSKAFAGSASSFSCTLREKCGLYNPVFILETQTFGNKYNYAEFEGLFYWIDDIISFPRNIIEVHCHLDPLASYQQDIFDTHAFATYAGFTTWNKWVDDNRMLPEVYESQHGGTQNAFGFTMTKDDGTVIITVFQCGNSDKQGVLTYALSISEYNTCLEMLYNVLDDREQSPTSNRNAIENMYNNISLPLTDESAKAQIAALSVMGNRFEAFLGGIAGDLAGLGNWRENIIKAVYVPIPKSYVVSNAGGADEVMYIGGIKIGTHKRINPSSVVITNNTLSVPWGTNVSGYPFLRLPKYQQFQVACMGGYYQVVDGTYFVDTSGQTPSLVNSISYVSSIDVCSGDWSIVINADQALNSMKFASFSGVCGIDITGYIGRGGSGALMNTLNTIGQFAAGAATGGAVTGYLHAGEGYAVTNNIGNGIEEKFGSTTLSGMQSGTGGGGISSLFLGGSTSIGKIHIMGVLYKPKIIEDNNYTDYCNEYGWPCNNYIKLGDHTGCLIKCAGASCVASAPQDALAYINATMNSGIYIEN